MLEKDTAQPGVYKLTDSIPPENIKLAGTVGLVDTNAILGISLSQDFEHIFPEVMPEYQWSKYHSTVTSKQCLTGVISADRFILDIHMGLNPTDSVKEIVKAWKLAATSFIMAPSKAIQIFGLDEPEVPLTPEEDISRDYKILAVHIWPSASVIEHNVKIRNESEIAEFVATKAFFDTNGRVQYRSIQMEEDTCGNRTKLLRIARKIRKSAAECDAQLPF